MFVLLMLLATLNVQAARPMPADFERRRILSESVMGKRPATDGEIQALLEGAITDPEPRMRQEGFGIVRSILWLSSMPQTPAGQEWAVRLRGVAETLKPAARAALDDTDAGVRLAALQITVMPETAPSRARAFTLTYDSVQLLAARFETDSSSMVRSFVVQSLTAAPRSDDPRITAIARRICVAALQDRDPYVVQYAGWMAFESKAPEALPLLIKQLQNPSHVARMGVAAGLQGYKAAAKPYLPQMEEALKKEPEGTTKKTLEATIRVVRESK